MLRMMSSPLPDIIFVGANPVFALARTTDGTRTKNSPKQAISPRQTARKQAKLILETTILED
jgi:hypothetical protein